MKLCYVSSGWKPRLTGKVAVVCSTEDHEWTDEHYVGQYSTAIKRRWLDHTSSLIGTQRKFKRRWLEVTAAYDSLMKLHQCLFALLLLQSLQGAFKTGQACRSITLWWIDWKPNPCLYRLSFLIAWSSVRRCKAT